MMGGGGAAIFTKKKKEKGKHFSHANLTDPSGLDANTGINLEGVRGRPAYRLPSVKNW